MVNWLCSNPLGCWYDYAGTIQFHIHVSLNSAGWNRRGHHRAYLPPDTRSKYRHDCNFHSCCPRSDLKVPRIPTDRPMSSVLQYFWNCNLVSTAFHETDSSQRCKISGQYNGKISMVCIRIFDHCILHVSCYRVRVVHRRMAGSSRNWSSGKWHVLWTNHTRLKVALGPKLLECLSKPALKFPTSRRNCTTLQEIFRLDRRYSVRIRCI